MIGKRIAHYRVDAQLGAGGMGVVYLAEDERLKRRVAIKVMAPALVNDPEARTRFLREARAASALDHPNIGTIHSIEEGEAGELFLVMAYYEGRTLDVVIRSQPFGHEETVEFGRKICAGLAAAHSRGIVHRDIKPSNVFLTKDGELKILDFGLAHIVGSDLTHSAASLGSPSYMSPEQANGDPVDERTDLWSLGVLLYEMATQQNPFRRDSLPATLYAIVHEEIPGPLPPSHLGEAIARCTAKNREQRPANALELLEILDGNALPSTATDRSDRTVVMSGVAPAKDPAGPVSRRPTALRWVLALAVLIVATGLWLRFRGGTEELRLAVLPPGWLTTAPAQDDERLAANVHGTLVRGLIDREGIVVLDPFEVTAVTADSSASLLALGADEILRAGLADHGDEWSITLDRLEVEDRTVLAHHVLSVPKKEPLRTASALASQIGTVFPEHASSRDNALSVNGADYENYLVALESYWARRDDTALPDRLDALESVHKGSPRFLDAWLLAANLAAYLYDSQRERSYFERAERYCREAIRLAPEDPRPHIAMASAAILASEAETAGEEIALLKEAFPNDPAWLEISAQFEQLTGDPEVALAEMREAARRLPMRSTRFELARLLNKQNRFEEARAELHALLADHASYRPARAKLAEIELLEGDPAVAARLCTELLIDGPDIGALVNRGLAYSLQREFASAAEDFNAALALAPGHPYLLLNAGDGETLAGGVERGKALYSQALASYGDEFDALDWQDLLVVAQCQVHLGMIQLAIGSVQRGLARASGAAEAYYLAALVYCRAGELQSALLNARLALEAGTQERWLDLPWFDELRELSGFQELVGGNEGGA